LGDLFEFSLTAFSAVFFVVDPIAAIPLFLAVTSDSTVRQRRATAFKAAVMAGAMLLLFALAGGVIFRVFGITIGGFRVAGGLLLFLMAVDMMRAQPSETRSSPAEVAEGQEKNEPGFVPLGVPMLAGPGAIATVSVLMSSARHSALKTVVVLLCVVVTAVATFLILRSAAMLQKVLKKTGLNVLNRVMGLILAAVAVQFVASGVRELFPALADASDAVAPPH
jgi:multiple antibiotic resistance protein